MQAKKLIKMIAIQKILDLFPNNIQVLGRFQMFR